LVAHKQSTKVIWEFGTERSVASSALKTTNESRWNGGQLIICKTPVPVRMTMRNKSSDQGAREFDGTYTQMILTPSARKMGSMLRIGSTHASPFGCEMAWGFKK
jgi:hypothetical protein